MVVDLRVSFVSLNTDDNSWGIRANWVWWHNMFRGWDFACWFTGHIGVSDSLYVELLAIMHDLKICGQRGLHNIKLFSNYKLALGLLIENHLVFDQFVLLIFIL